VKSEYRVAAPPFPLQSCIMTPTNLRIQPGVIWGFTI